MVNFRASEFVSFTNSENIILFAGNAIIPRENRHVPIGEILAFDSQRLE